MLTALRGVKKKVKRDMGGYVGSVAWAEKILQPFNAQILYEDSQKLTFIPDGPYDLVHVDGQQDKNATAHDLNMAMDCAEYVLMDGYYWNPINIDAINSWLPDNIKRIEWYVVIPVYASDLLIRPRK